MAELADFHEQAKEPVELSLRVAVQVRPSSLWVGVYRLDGSAHPGGSHVRSARYDRPPGKDLGQCVEAAVALLGLWASRGEIL